MGEISESLFEIQPTQPLIFDGECSSVIREI